MKIEITPTDQLVQTAGSHARLWRGTLPSGAQVDVLVAGVGGTAHDELKAMGLRDVAEPGAAPDAQPPAGVLAAARSIAHAFIGQVFRCNPEDRAAASLSAAAAVVKTAIEGNPGCKGCAAEAVLKDLIDWATERGFAHAVVVDGDGTARAETRH